MISETRVRLDGHVDLPREPVAADRGALPKLTEGGVNALVLTLRADVHPPSDQITAGRADLAKGYARVLDSLDGGLTLARDPLAVHRIVDAGGTAVILGLQNAAPLTTVEEFGGWIDKGVSVVALTFIGNNRWAESSRPYPFVNHPSGVSGLTSRGRDAIRWLNRHGVIIDVSQLADRAVDDVLAVSTAPVIASHTGLRRTVDIARNLPDRLAVAITERGGIVQLVGFSMYVTLAPEDRLPGLIRLWKAHGLPSPRDPHQYYSIDAADTANWSDGQFFDFLHEYHVILRLDEPHASVSDYVAALGQAIDLVGIRGVGIASDFNHGGGLRDWIDASQTEHVIDELRSRGYNDNEVDLLFGGNFLDVWRRVREIPR